MAQPPGGQPERAEEAEAPSVPEIATEGVPDGRDQGPPPAPDDDATGLFPGARDQGPPPAPDDDATGLFPGARDHGPPADRWRDATGQSGIVPGMAPATGTQSAVAPGSPPPAEAYPGQPWPGTAPRQRSRRTAVWVTVALVLALLLCGGGGLSAFLLLRNAENGEGAPDPATAVNRFLTAVYTDQDAQTAAGLVCHGARDQKKITAKIAEVKGYARMYDEPTFTWDTPTVAGVNDERARVSVAVTMTTRDEKTSRQSLTFTTVRKTGWWVCEVSG